MTYRRYAEEWHLTPTVTTGTFAIYPIVIVTILILFGNISDHVSRRTTMLLGLTDLAVLVAQATHDWAPLLGHLSDLRT